MEERIVDALRSAMRGEVLVPGDDGYDEARKIWNARYDRRPDAIARCHDRDDVVAAVNAARESGTSPAVRSGGHDFGGNSVCEGGLMIDLSPMTDVEVDAASQRVRVQPGVRWREVDVAAQEEGLATTGGTVSSVGVTGYTLGGGTGWLARKHGLALDNLVSAEIVLANGELVTASDDENADLFWAIRGGSGNFGIVTSFVLQLHQLRGDVQTGQILYPHDQAAEVLREFRSFMESAPDELQVFAFFMHVPPLEIFPEEYHGQVALDLVVGYFGDPAEGDKIIEPLRNLGEPFFLGIDSQPYTALQQAFDAGMPSGLRWYTKGHYLAELSDAAIDTIVSETRELPGAFTLVYLEPLGGAIGRVGPDDTAFPHREAKYSIHILPGWQEPADDAVTIEWARGVHRKLESCATGGTYVNLLDGDEENLRRAAYGDHYDRLQKIKRTYDPENLFRKNHNIEP